MQADFGFALVLLENIGKDNSGRSAVMQPG